MIMIIGTMKVLMMMLMMIMIVVILQVVIIQKQINYPPLIDFIEFFFNITTCKQLVVQATEICEHKFRKPYQYLHTRVLYKVIRTIRNVLYPTN